MEDTAFLYLRTQGNAMGIVNLSWSYSGDPESYMKIFGTEGIISLGLKCSKYKHIGGSDCILYGKGYDEMSCVRRQLANFISLNPRPLSRIEGISLESAVRR